MTRTNVLTDVIAAGNLTAQRDVRNLVHDRFNDFMAALDQGSPKDRYEAAVKLAGIALRYASDNRLQQEGP